MTSGPFRARRPRERRVLDVLQRAATTPWTALKSSHSMCKQAFMGCPSNRLLVRYAPQEIPLGDKACSYRHMSCALCLASDDWKGNASSSGVNQRFLELP